MKNPYQVLGVSPDATDAEIKRVYLRLAQKYHPDKFTGDPGLAEIASEKMKEINTAYSEIKQQREAARKAGGKGFNGNAYADHETLDRFAEVRQLINENRLRDAEKMLESTELTSRNAEWYYLMGAIFEVRGYLREALRFYDIACRMDPYNPEYRGGRDRLDAQQPGRTYRYTPQDDDRDSTDTDRFCDICLGLFCADKCCNCLGGDLFRCC